MRATIRGEAPASVSPATTGTPGSHSGEDPVSGETPTDPGTAPIPGDDGPLRLESLSIAESEGGRIVDVTLAGRSGADSPVTLTGDTLQGSTPEGDPVPRFFAPFTPEAILAPDEDTLVTVRFWLTEEADTLVLRYRGQELRADLAARSPSSAPDQTPALP